MKREILFRGQTRRKGERVTLDGTPIDNNWVYGGIFYTENDFSVIYTYDPVEKFPVYSDTVGQYTGLIDKNGVKIFEDDLLLLPKVGIFRVVWGEYSSWMLRDKNGKECFALSTYAKAGKKNEAELAGNIFDNPKLWEQPDEQ